MSTFTPRSAHRRNFMRNALAVGAAAALPWSLSSAFAQAAQAAGGGKGTKLVLLGTKAGPTPSPLRGQPANLLLVDGQPYVIDCGNGVGLQLVKAGVKLPGIRDIFITHQHSDHNMDMGNLVFQAWGTGLRSDVHLYGPPPIRHMMDDFLDMNKVDIEVRMREEGRPALAPLIHAHEFSKDGVVLENDQVKVTAALVDHLSIKPAFAYRFDTKDRSVVFSGDTAYNENLIRLAKGADVLVHEVLYVPAIEKMLETVDDSPKLLDHLIHSHTTTDEVGKVAAAAGVKTLVLSHFAPGTDPDITDEMWAGPARKVFKGEVIVGQDLMVI